MKIITAVLVSILALFRLWLGVVLGGPIGMEMRRGIPHWRYADGVRLPIMAGGTSMMLQEIKFAKGIDPIGDALAGTVNSDIYSMRGHGRILFVVYCGLATGGTATAVFTVDACDDVTPSNTTAIPFWYREIVTGDTEGAITRATSAGFTCTAGSSKIILIEVDAADVAAANVNSTYGNHFVRLHSVEGVNDPVVAGLNVILGGGPNRYIEDINATVIV